MEMEGPKPFPESRRGIPRSPDNEDPLLPGATNLKDLKAIKGGSESEQEIESSLR